MSTAVRSPRAPRSRSAFAAAFLSLVFPGLGHAYAGAWARALSFAAVPFLVIAAAAGIALRTDRFQLVAIFANPNVLSGLLLANALAFLYRAAAAVDAWMVARLRNEADARGDAHAGRSRLPANPLSIAGLAAVILVLAGGHVAVWHYDALALSVVNCINPDNADASCDEPSASPNPSDAVPSDSGAGSDQPTDSPIPSDVPTPADSGSAATPAASLPPWNGTDRLNILLVGTDQRPGDTTFNTDTTIVVSIDPKTKQVAMLQVPRDTTNVPCPQVALSLPLCSGGSYSGKINSWFRYNQSRTNLWAGKNSITRGMTSLQAILGNLYGININYWVMVNFGGFISAVDTLGGIQVNVQIPVAEDEFPITDRIKTRVYIPAGPQEMDGQTALIYARSRHNSEGGDFDRGRRQQRVILSLKNEMDPQTVFANLPSLVDALKTAVKSNLPVGDSGTMGRLLDLASQIDTKNIRSYVFAPPTYAKNMWPVSSDLVINVARVRSTVRQAFSLDLSILQTQEQLTSESAQVWVENGKGLADHATNNFAYLSYFGVDASVPGVSASTTPSQTTITVYNGAEQHLPQTIAFLQKTYHVTIATATDPSAKAEIVIVLGRDGRDLPLPTAG